MFLGMHPGNSSSKSASTSKDILLRSSENKRQGNPTQTLKNDGKGSWKMILSFLFGFRPSFRGETVRTVQLPFYRPLRNHRRFGSGNDYRGTPARVSWWILFFAWPKNAKKKRIKAHWKKGKGNKDVNLFFSLCCFFVREVHVRVSGGFPGMLMFF